MFNKLKNSASVFTDKVREVAEDVSDTISDNIPNGLKESSEAIKESVDSALEAFGDIYDSELDNIESYCSWCFEKHTCTLKEKGGLSRNIYICSGCNREIVKCRACDNKAKYSSDLEDKNESADLWSNNFCAVHNGTIAKFETLNWKLSTIGEYRDIVERKETNYKKIGTTAAYTIGGAAVIAPLAFAAAPAVGGAIGTSFLGYSGAVATNTGLATLGGGALAAGGAGMAGGVAVVTAAGSALGGKYGAVISNSYFGDIDGFDIVRVKQGLEPAIICIDGFLNEKVKSAPDSWLEPISELYPDNTIYYIRWESKRLHDLASTFSSFNSIESKKNFVYMAAQSASKAAAKKLVPLSAAFHALNLTTNPWSVASIKAYQTGALLADIIARTDKEYILVGHSLGARVIYSCLASLKTKENKFIKDVHLLGGAVSNLCDENTDEGGANWFGVEQAVSGEIYNYYSKNDDVLKYLYSIGEGIKYDFGSPIGRSTINTKYVNNIDVSAVVSGHTKYKSSLAEILEA